MRLGITVSKSLVSAVALKRGRVMWAAEAPYADLRDLAAVLAALGAERPRGIRQAAVALDGEVACLKSVAGLPPLKRRDLAAHVRLNSRRYFLQNGIPLVTDAVALKEPGTGALLAGAPVPLVEALGEGLEAAGLRCRLIAPAALLPDLAACMDLKPGLATAFRAARASSVVVSLLPEAARARNQFAERQALRRWTVAALLACALALASWFMGRQRAIATAGRELALLTFELNEALVLRRDLDATDQALSVIGALDAGNARRARFLADLSRALPDSAFLVNLLLNPDGTGSLSGYAPRAASVVARLERYGVARGSAFEGPVTREVVGGRELERFAVRFRAAFPEQRP